MSSKVSAATQIQSPFFYASQIIFFALGCADYTNLAGLSVCAECFAYRHLRRWREPLTRVSCPCLHLEGHHGLNRDVLRRRRTGCRRKVEQLFQCGQSWVVGSIPPTTAIPTATEHDQDHNDEDKKRGGIHLGLLLGVSISPRAKPRRLGETGASCYRSLDRLASGSLGSEKPICL